MARTGSSIAMLMLLLTGAAAAPPAGCRGEQSCLSTEGPRSGGAMLQTLADKEAIVGTREASVAGAGTAPLRGRLETLEKEVDTLKKRTTDLETEVVGGEGSLPSIPEAPEAPPEAAALQNLQSDDSAPPDQRFMSLAQGAADIEKGESMKTRVAAVEADVASLKSKISMLENQVMGKDGLSLLEKVAGSSLKSRIVSLEEEVDLMRSRVSSLEHTVKG
mmetsp:Transcript_97627/g.209473  ORF Transcript_97627/g.209473 Transcript_97627/m.209473 type:complete len:219 (-) Transcript_97627:126-782(-)